jgi:hypothetical protein
VNLIGPSRFLFRPVWEGHVFNTSSAADTVNTHLQLYLRAASIFEGETLRGLRSGGAILAALGGDSLQAILGQAHWSNPHMADRYMRLCKVLGQGALTPVARRLGRTFSRPPIANSRFWRILRSIIPGILVLDLWTMFLRTLRQLLGRKGCISVNWMSLILQAAPRRQLRLTCLTPHRLYVLPMHWDETSFCWIGRPHTPLSCYMLSRRQWFESPT